MLIFTGLGVTLAQGNANFGALAVSQTYYVAMSQLPWLLTQCGRANFEHVGQDGIWPALKQLWHSKQALRVLICVHSDEATPVSVT